ncbi:MAG TPA: TolC family protein [Kiritimatiellia bacterium]|nr:TolC family protein [Kiritimatiellia bacterium]
MMRSLRAVSVSTARLYLMLLVGWGIPGVAVGSKTFTLSLEECIAMALELNQGLPASRYAVEAAEAQHRQVLSAYWPQVMLRGAFELTDEPSNFIFPSSTFGIPAMNLPVAAQTFTVPPGTVMIRVPARLVNPSAPPGATIELPVATPEQSIRVPEQSFTLEPQSLTIPDQEVKLQDRDSWYGSVGGQWLLWDGGMRKGLRTQTQAGMRAAREEVRRTELEIVDSVTRLYYGAVMAAQVREVGDETLARMQATLNLTETMYKEGAGTVKKTDYLGSKVVVETLRGAVALLEQNEGMAQAALAYTIGLGWSDTVKPVAREVPFVAVEGDLEAMVADAYLFSPDWKRLEAGLSAAEGAVREARSGHYPKVALTGELHKWWNDHDSGLATRENKEGWTVMVGAELPLFQGFLTRNRVKEARARMSELQSKEVLLREGLGLQIRMILLGLDSSGKRYQSTKDALAAASENRDLNTRAYQNELVETEDVILAQLMEAFMKVQHFKLRFDHVELVSRLNLIVGTEVLRLFE